MNKIGLILSTNLSAVIAIVFLTVITITGELYKVAGANGKMVSPIKDFLKAIFGHHWVGKGVLAVALFVILSGLLYIIFRKQSNSQSLVWTLSLLTYTLILGTVTIFGFNIYEFVISH